MHHREMRDLESLYFPLEFFPLPLPLHCNLLESAPICLLGMCQHTDPILQLLQVFFLLPYCPGSILLCTDLTWGLAAVLPVHAPY